MDIQKIKELALANGFSLKEQASGNMDLHSYVYEFAQAIENEVLAQARSVFGQKSTIQKEKKLFNEYWHENNLPFDGEEVFKKYAWDAWQAAKAQAIPEGFVLAHKELPEHIAESMALERVEIPSYESSPTWAKISEDAYKGRLHSKKWELWRDYKEMIQAQEQGHE